MRSERLITFKINNLEVSFSAIHTVWTLWSCIYHEYSKIHLRKKKTGTFHGKDFQPPVQSGTVVFATPGYLPQKYFAICQRTINRGWIKWAQVSARVAWKPKMHDDVLLNMASLGFVYGLLLGNCRYQTDRKIYDQSEIAVRLRSSRDTRATNL